MTAKRQFEINDSALGNDRGDEAAAWVQQTESGLVRMTAIDDRFSSPFAVYQYMPGAPNAETRAAGTAMSKLLAALGIPAKKIGIGFGEAADAVDFLDIPGHGDFVLMLHDHGTLTEEAFCHIANLSAPILLLYYTVQNRNERTGPARWAMAKAALGMDPMASWALRKAGFESAMQLILPPDDEILPVAGAAKGYRILAPGDLTARSNVLTILCAYARFRQEWREPSQLCLAGRTLDSGIAKAVQEVVREHGLQEEVTITGSLEPDAWLRMMADSTLCAFLGAADVLPEAISRAASAGLPVVAPAIPAVCYRLGEAGLPDSVLPVSADELAAAFLHFAREPAALARLAAAQARFHGAVASKADSARIVSNALGRCGLALPIVAAEREQLFQQLGFVVAGHFEGSYSIAAVNRMLAAALERRRPGSVQLLPVAFQQKRDVLQEIPPDENELQQRLFARGRPNAAPVVAISQHFPPWIPDIPNDLALCLFTWEETLVPAAIVDTINKGFAGVLAVSRFAAKALIDSGLRRPVKVVGQAVNAVGFPALASARAPHEVFTVLHVSSCFPRKGVDILLRAWGQAFNRDENVRLIIKTFPNPHQRIADDVERLRETHPGLAPIGLIDEDLDAAELRALFRDADCVALPARGEGFNMVAAEAILAGLKPIVTGFGGHLDFVNRRNSRLLDFHLARSQSHVAAAGAFWAEPEVDDLVRALREAFAAYREGQVAGLTPRATADVMARLDAAAWAEKIADFAVELICRAPRSLRRIAWISSWGVRCGIAEYSLKLLQHRKLGPGEPQVLLLCDTRSLAATGQEIDAAAVLPVWRQGAQQVAAEIAPHLESFDPQVVVIQHQAGLISWEDLIDMVEEKRGLAVRLIVVLHSTEAILSLYHKLQASVLFSLSLVSRVVVHTLRDMERLRGLGLFENVMVLPHGAGKMLPPPARKPRYLQSPVLGCYGFFLPHKGIATLIEAFAHVVREWPAARLRLVNARFPSVRSSAEIKLCRALARRLRVDHAIEWHLGYLEEVDARTLLSGCDLLVMPYDETPESVSGAVRHALASGSPVAVSHSNIFDELGDTVHRVDAADAERLYRDIAALLADTAHCGSVLAPASIWLAQHDWAVITRRFFDMAEGLWQSPEGTSFRGLVLTPKNRLLENTIGRRTEKQLIFSGEAEGFGLYGPYIDLGAGAYRVVFSFERASERVGKARFEAISQLSGLKLAAREQAFAGSENDEVSLEFVVRQKVREVEFRIFCHAGFRAVLEAVSVELLAVH